MQSVFVLQHLHVLPNGEEDVKMIGVYATEAAARAAVDRLRGQPGFRDFPEVVDPEADGPPDGFWITRYPLNQDHWQEGFVTL